jgi:hypothetical protein
MISLSKYFSNLIDTKGRRILKVMGLVGAATADHSAPFGDDSCPVKGMDALYATTGSDELPVVIGYINFNQIAKEGEKRLFSLKKISNLDGSVTYVESFYAYFKNDGTFELGGKADNAVRYSPLNTALSNHNTNINTELTKIQVALTSLGGTYARGTLNLDISGAKIEEIKTL